ncbi:MAG: penicillin-binding protein 2 [Verrucomicrobiae bacterium]|nr:penicillin-binding protein 2 [Verrucomicrobiae bacterium]
MNAGAIHYRRLWVCITTLAIAVSALAYRLIDLQVLRHEEYKLRAEANTQRKYLLPAIRGQIKDISGNILALSVPVKTVCADPTFLGPYYPQIARILAPYLQMSETELAERLTPRVRLDDSGKLITNRYVVLKRKVSVETYEQIKSIMKNISFGIDEKNLPLSKKQFFKNLRESAIFADKVDDQLRVYPNGSLASHILGYVGMENKLVNGVEIIETVGIAGIERMLNQNLAGVPGWRVTEKDSRNRELVSYRQQDVEPIDGLNVILTIDSRLQYILEKELLELYKKQNPISAQGIIVRPKTGEILAMAVYPNFDPNKPGQYPEEYRRNRIIEEVHEPGSTFKLVVIAGAMNEKRIKLTDTIDCENGRFEYCGRVIHDHGHGSKTLTVEEILERSSNVGASKIGLLLGPQLLYDYVRKFGFGSRTGVSLPAEIPGIVHPTNKWHKTSIISISFGHEIAVTPLQTIMAVSAIANNGILMTPMLIDRLEDKNGNITVKYNPQQVREVITKETARLITSAMERVTTGKSGTARRAAMELYTVAGKTGTAEKPGPGGYQRDKNFSSFVGFFPTEDPELCIGIFVDEPKEGRMGGVVCAPVFKNIAEQAAAYLCIQPDIKPEENAKEQLKNRTVANQTLAKDYNQQTSKSNLKWN